jgi:hypothetical protein
MEQRRGDSDKEKWGGNVTDMGEKDTEENIRTNEGELTVEN